MNEPRRTMARTHQEQAAEQRTLRDDPAETRAI